MANRASAVAEVAFLARLTGLITPTDTGFDARLRIAAILANLHRNSPVFRHQLDNIEMALAEEDLPIASLYVYLAQDHEAAQRIWARIKAEFHLTEHWLKHLAGSAELLAGNQTLALSLARRAPYIDAVNALQARLISRGRGADGQNWHQAILLSVNAIAAGMRNTG